MTKARLAVALVAAILALAAPHRTLAADTLEIPTILPMTGPAAFLGKEYADTLKLLEERLNKTGGVAGRQIHFAIVDDQTSPQIDVQLTTAALQKKVPLIIDGAPLALCRATAPLMPNGPVMWCLSPSMVPTPGSYVMAVMAPSRDSIVAGLNYFRGRGFKKLGVLDSTDATGADTDASIVELMKLPAYAGMSVVAMEHFNIADLSVAAQISRIKAGGAQAMFGFTTGTPVATILRGMADGGLDIPVFTSQGNMSIAQLDSYKAFMPKELLFPGYAARSREGRRVPRRHEGRGPLAGFAARDAVGSGVPHPRNLQARRRQCDGGTTARGARRHSQLARRFRPVRLPRIAESRPRRELDHHFQMEPLHVNVGGREQRRRRTDQVKCRFCAIRGMSAPGRRTSRPKRS